MVSRGFEGFWDPWRELSRMERAFGGSPWGGSSRRGGAQGVAMNVRADQTQVTVTAELPGVAQEDLEVQVVGRRLTIRGQRATGEPEAGGRYHRRERDGGRFGRAVTLPFPVEADKVAATLKNGVLTVTLPRAEADRPRRIAVQAA